MTHIISLAIKVRITNSKITKYLPIFLSRLHSDLGITKYQKEFIVDHTVDWFSIIFVLLWIVGKIIQTIILLIVKRQNKALRSHIGAFSIFSWIVSCNYRIFGLQNQNKVLFSIYPFMVVNVIIFLSVIKYFSLFNFFIHMLFYTFNQEGFLLCLGLKNISCK